MKERILKSVLLAVVVLLVPVTVAATGQVHAIKVTVPFEFYIDGQTHPAGDYRLELSTLPLSDAILLTTSDRQAIRLVSAHRCDPKVKSAMPYLLFRSYGRQNFLAQIWTGESARTLVMSKAEREIVKNTPKLALKGLQKSVMIAGR